jgi:hypothetical protein
MPHTATLKNPPHIRRKPVFHPLAFSILADQIFQVIEAHGYATSVLLATFLARPLRTVQNTCTSMSHARRLVPLAYGKRGTVWALRIPSVRRPNIQHEVGCLAGDLALAYCEDRGYGTVLPISDATKNALLQLPVLKRPDRLMRWLRPGDQDGMELLREFQRSTLTRNELRDKLFPYFALDMKGKRILLETETKADAEKYLKDLKTLIADPQWLKRVWVTCQSEYLQDFERYVKAIWTNLDGRTYSLVKE